MGQLPFAKLDPHMSAPNQNDRPPVLSMLKFSEKKTKTGKELAKKKFKENDFNKAEATTKRSPQYNCNEAELN
jgi:hypothetical protein